ncbi:amidohydrolase family protein [Streptomyces sp. NBC_01023]|nr:amidohydrolase family protein [Streptomyces sp. NBC_01023]
MDASGTEYASGHVVVAGHRINLFDWLVSLYPVWARIDEPMVHAAAQGSLAALALSGVTTAADHHYVFPRGAGDSPFSVTSELLRSAATLARAKGVRLHTHGSETREEEEYCMLRYGMTPKYGHPHTGAASGRARRTRCAGTERVDGTGAVRRSRCPRASGTGSGSRSGTASRQPVPVRWAYATTLPE